MPSTIQARFGETGFPIGRFILDKARDLALSRTDLVRRLGYRELGKGHCALSELLMTGMVPPLIAQNLASALESDQEIVDAVLLATAQQQHDSARNDSARTKVLAQEESYRTDFQPHLQVQTERRVPSPIFVAAIMGVARLRVVQLPEDAFAASGDLHPEIVKDVIVEHYRSQGGQVAAYGVVTGYVLVLVPGYDGCDFGVR
jgi:hypothetical protein